MRSLKRWYGRCILEKGKETFLWAFIAFGISVGISRAIVLDVEKGKAIFGYLYIKGYHIHHFYWGILLLISSSWLALIRYKRLHRRVFKGIASIMFGGGLGLIVDEFWLLLTEFGIKGNSQSYYAIITRDELLLQLMRDNYWAPQSYYAIGVTSAIFLAYLLFLRAD